MSESYEDYTGDEWERSLTSSLEKLDSVDENFIHRQQLPSAESKEGEPLEIELIYYYFSYGDNYNEKIPCDPPGNGLMHYMFTKNSRGEIIGTRIATIFDEGTTLRVKGEIRVKNRGKGMATPIENAFIAELKDLANREGKKVIWEVTNRNKERLQEVRAEDGLNPALLKALEEEQARWQVLYGADGKFKQKIFKPED